MPKKDIYYKHFIHMVILWYNPNSSFDNLAKLKSRVINTRENPYKCIICNEYYFIILRLMLEKITYSKI